MLQQLSWDTGQWKKLKESKQYMTAAPPHTHTHRVSKWVIRPPLGLHCVFSEKIYQEDIQRNSLIEIIGLKMMSICIHKNLQVT